MQTNPEIAVRGMTCSWGLNARRLMEARSQAWRPHVTTPLHPNAAVHHSKKLRADVADGSVALHRGGSRRSRHVSYASNSDPSVRRNEASRMGVG